GRCEPDWPYFSCLSSASLATSRDRFKGAETLKEANVPREPPSFVSPAIGSDVSRSNRATLFQSRYLCRLFHSRSICVSKFLPAQPGTPCRARNFSRTATPVGQPRRSACQQFFP